MQFTARKALLEQLERAGAATPTRDTEGNHFGDNFTTLGDYLDAQCRTTGGPDDRHQRRDPVCRGQQRREQDRPAVLRSSAQLQAERRLRAADRPVNLTFGALTEFISKRRYERQRTVNVLLPGTTRPTGQRPRPTSTTSAARIRSMVSSGALDTSVEATWRIASTHRPASRRRSSTSPTSGESTIRTTSCGAVGRGNGLRGGSRELRQGDGARIVPRRADDASDPLVPLLDDLPLLTTPL